jgi:hypothetical protein
VAADVWLRTHGHRDRPVHLPVSCNYHQYHFLGYSTVAQCAKGPLIIEASRSHSDTPQSVGLLWMCDQPNA